MGPRSPQTNRTHCITSSMLSVEEAEEGGEVTTNRERLRRLIAKLKYWILKRISMRAKVNP
jgi:hypothetical protein